ncbi:hypothetical protein SSPO_097350 [Streptomyces antimycoticus]|uniref:Uncharacterized protein n=1 Tax=Streptomyces antimycoticus TaxID=68175 RepID=A0A499VLD9_9ACTN|nr:hypothetical protein [Streptomyces antimycoticus]BBJ47017.1 hypothetical protein SSPO_097350 [Streptomyces antimycoticus]
MTYVTPPQSGRGRLSGLLLESEEVEVRFEVPIAPLAEWLNATYRITSAEAEMDGLD